MLDVKGPVAACAPNKDCLQNTHILFTIWGYFGDFDLNYIRGDTPQSKQSACNGGIEKGD